MVDVFFYFEEESFRKVGNFFFVDSIERFDKILKILVFNEVELFYRQEIIKITFSFS